MKKLKKFLLLSVLFLLVFLVPCYSSDSETKTETMYQITESELIQLELNNQMTIEQTEKLKQELILLNQSLEQTKTSLTKSEKEKKTIKVIGITGSIVLFFGGFYLGYKLNK